MLKDCNKKKCRPIRRILLKANHDAFQGISPKFWYENRNNRLSNKENENQRQEVFMICSYKYKYEYQVYLIKISSL